MQYHKICITDALLTPWGRVLLEKLTGPQLVKKFPEFCGTRRFITAFTIVRHLSLSWSRSIQPILPHPTSWRSILISSSYLRLGLPSGLFPSGSPTTILCTPLLSPYMLHAPPISIFKIWSPGKYTDALKYIRDWHLAIVIVHVACNPVTTNRNWW